MSPISSFIIPASGAITLKSRRESVLSKNCRVAVQYNDDRSSVGSFVLFHAQRQYIASTRLEAIFQDIMTFQDVVIPSGMQPAFIYIRTTLVGSDLQYNLAGFLSGVDSS